MLGNKAKYLLWWQIMILAFCVIIAIVLVIVLVRGCRKYKSVCHRLTAAAPVVNELILHGLRIRQNLRQSWWCRRRLPLKQFVHHEPSTTPLSYSDTRLFAGGGRNADVGVHTIR